MLKKVLLVVMCVALLGTMVVGCSAPASEGSASVTSSDASAAVETAKESVEPKADGERIKIGVNFFNYTMPLAQDLKRMIDSAAEALDCDVEYAANDFEDEKVVTGIENLFASGCDAVIVCNSAEGQIPKALKVAEQYDGKVFQFFRTLNEEEVKNAAFSSPYYGGQVHEDEMQVGYNMGKIVNDKGCKNVGIINYNHGDLTAETRYEGYMKAFEEFGINVVAETWEVATGEQGTQVTENYLASYPEMDALVVVGGGGENLIGAMSALQKANKTDDIVLVSTDFTDTLIEDMESGTLDAMSGGHWCDPFFSFMLAYNSVAGAEWAQEPVEIAMDMIYVTSGEEAKQYDEWFRGDILPYTAEEIQQLSITHNSSLTKDEFIETAQSLSLQDVMERHADLKE